MSGEPRFSAPGDEPGLRALFQEVFHETDAFLDAFFERVYTPGMAALIEAEGHIAAAAYALPFGALRYIYAVSTLPECRGRGYGAAVTLYAAHGQPACLYPASPTLRHWYARAVGAVTVSRLADTSLPGSPTARLTAEEYNAAREACLRGVCHAAYSLPVLRLFEADGGFYRGDGFLCALDADGAAREVLTPAGVRLTDAPGVMALNGATVDYWGLLLD